MNKVSSVFIILFFSHCVYGQDLSVDLKWSQINEQPTLLNYFSNLQIAGSNSTYIAAPASIFNGVDLGILSAKYDSTGNLLWQNIYNTFTLDQLWDAELDHEENFVIGGTTTYPNAQNTNTSFVLIKYASDGEELWVNEYFELGEVNTSLRDLFIDDDGNIYVIGTGSINDFIPHMTVFKFNPSGELIWKNNYNFNTFGLFGQILNNETIVALGYGGGNYIVQQLSILGDSITSFENIKEDEFSSHIKFDSDGNIYLGDQAREYKVTKVNLQGDTLWHYQLPVIDPPGPEVYARLTALTVDEEKNVYASGIHYQELTGGFAIVTTKLNEFGEVLWSNRYGETAYPPRSIKIENEVLFVGGTTNIDEENRDFLLLGYSKEGNLLMDLSYDYNDNDNEIIISFDIQEHNLFIMGFSSASNSAFDSTFAIIQRYCIDGIVSVTEIQEKISHIYPNPIQKEFTIFSSEYLKADASVIFYNQLGQRVAHFSLEKGAQVHNFVLEDVANGIYFYSIFQQGQIIRNGKIVVGRE